MLCRSRNLVIVCLFGIACSTPSPPPSEHQQRIERAEQDLENDPIVQAHRAAVEAAQASEERPKLVDGIELRVGDGYLDNDHQIRPLARLKVRHPIEVRAEREALRAGTEIEIARLEEASLERRAALCFPSVEALALDERNSIYADYAERQQPVALFT